MGYGEESLSRLRVERGAPRAARPHDPEIVTRAETQSQTLQQLHGPGAPWGGGFV